MYLEVCVVVKRRSLSHFMIDCYEVTTTTINTTLYQVLRPRVFFKFLKIDFENLFGFSKILPGLTIEIDFQRELV